MHETNHRVVALCCAVITRVGLSVAPWTLVLQASLSMEFSRQEYWSGLPFPTPGNLPHPGIKPTSCVSCIGRQILYHWATWEALKPSHFSKKVKGLFLVTLFIPQKLSEVSSHVGHYSFPSCHFLSLLLSPLNTWKCWFLTSSTVWDFPRAFFSIPGWLLPYPFPGVIMGVGHEGIWGLKE